MLKNISFRLVAYIVPLVVVYFYARLFGQVGMGGISCTFNDFTGMYCPGCGGQRAFKALLHGEFLKALRFNALIFVMLPILLYAYVYMVETTITSGKGWLAKFTIPSVVGYIVIGLLGVFFILRNIPFYPFTKLIP